VRARVADAEGRERDVFATIGPGASLGCNPMRAYLGLGDAASLQFVEVRWPAAGETQRVEGVAMDGVVRVTQGSGAERIVLPGKPPSSDR